MKVVGRIRKTAGSRNRDSGFTLLEVLLTALLSATLMMGLWSLFGTYLRLFKSGQAKTEQTQLLRALSRQISDDLHGVIDVVQSGSTTAVAAARLTAADAEQSSSRADAGATASISGGEISALAAADTAESPAPRFRLTGSAQSLQLVVLQVSPHEMDGAPAAGSFGDETTGMTTGPRAPEFKTILYTFSERGTQHPESGGTDDEPLPERENATGLIRAETIWEASHSDAADLEFLERGTTASGSASGTFGTRGPRTTDADESHSALVPDDSLLSVPEVVNIEFRYYDGRQWQSDWDSVVRGSLPVAVEVAMQLDFNGETDSDAPPPNLTAETSAALDSENTAGETEVLPIYRQLYFLTSATSPASAADSWNGGHSFSRGSAFQSFEGAP